MAESLSFEELLDRDGRLAFTNKGVSMLPLLLRIALLRGKHFAGRCIRKIRHG